MIKAGGHMNHLNNDFLTLEEVSTFMGITVKTLRNRLSARKDHPPFIKGVKRFRKDAFYEWLKSYEIRQLNKIRYQ
jgi:hypothetical protein